MLMWFVNIDHWTLKLAYLAFEKVTDNQTENINQVDISIFFFKVKKEALLVYIIHSTVQWIRTIILIYNGTFSFY